MPYADNNGVRIHYEVEGNGPPLVLQHGGTGSLQDWYDSDYVEPLEKEYQLILIDGRGFGHSDKPHDTESYDLELRVGDMVAVLDDLNITKSHYLGYSMGGWLGYGVAKYVSERFYSLIIGGAHAYARSFEAQRQQLSKGMEAYVAFLEENFGPLPANDRAITLANDAQALIACQQDRPAMDDVLSGMTMPCLVYATDADESYQEIKKGVALMPNATFVTLPGLDHYQGWLRSDLVLPHVNKFLSAVVQGVGAAS